MNETNKTETLSPTTEPTARGSVTREVNTHFVLVVVAICVSCFTGFFAIPLALAALIFSLRAQDQVQQGNWTQAKKTAYWAGLFGWVTVCIALIPIVLMIFFGGAILAWVLAVLSAV